MNREDLVAKQAELTELFQQKFADLQALGTAEMDDAERATLALELKDECFAIKNEADGITELLELMDHEAEITAVEVEEPVVEDEVEVVAEDTTAEVEEAEVKIVEVVEAELVAAGTEIELANSNDFRSEEFTPMTSALTVTASAEVPGYATGTTIDSGIDLAKAALAKARNISGSTNRAPIATLNLDHDFVLGTDSVENGNVLSNLANAAEQSIVAAGWCAPQQVIYDFVAISDRQCNLDIPSVQVTRGGVQYPVAPTVADLTYGGFVWTDVEDCDPAATKDCGEVPCVDMASCDLVAVGTCITIKNMMDRAFPEAVEHYINLLMKAHEMNVAARCIADIQANAVAIPALATGGTVGAVINNISFAVEQFRDVHCVGGTLEILLPSWLRAAIRADLAHRNCCDLRAVTDRDIEAAFGPNVRVQFSCAYLPLTDADTAWPATAKALIWKAGTVAKADGGTIELAMSDSNTIATNSRMWFMEEFLCTIVRGPVVEACIDVCVSGQTGAADIAC